MKVIRCLVKDDIISLQKDINASSSIGYVYEVIVSARCKHYDFWFEHNEPLTYYAIKGNFLFEIGETQVHVVQGSFIDIPANVPYRLRSIEHQPAKLMAFAESPSVEDSWHKVSESLRCSSSAKAIAN